MSKPKEKNMGKKRRKKKKWTRHNLGDWGQAEIDDARRSLAEAGRLLAQPKTKTKPRNKISKVSEKESREIVISRNYLSDKWT